MPPKKKTPCNAFYFFMLERKAQYEKNGERFPNGLKDVSEVVGSEWAVMTPAMKKKYEDMAKEEKARQKGDTSRKYTNQHNTFEFVDKSKAEEEEARFNMMKDIETTVTSLCTTKKIAGHRFYLIHINYFCVTEGECYHPAELAVAEFSLAEGVTDVYHTIVSFGNIPLGYRNDAQMRSDQYHHIPIEPEGAEKQMYTVWSKVKGLLERGRSAHGGKYPPMYTMPENLSINTSIDCVKSVVQTLCEGCGENPEDFKIYSLDKLFYELNNTCAEMSGTEDSNSYFPSIPFACSKLEDDIYNFTPTIACSFHYDEDQVVNCSKSFVQRWVYLICDSCCQYLNIQLVPGRHVPLNSDVNYKAEHDQREMERKSEGAVGFFKPHHSAKPLSGKPTKTFMPVAVKHPPLPQPTVQTSVPKPVPKPMPVLYDAIDTSEENFPAIPIGRGRGKITPRGGGGRGSGPMNFAAATQGRK